LDKEVLLKFLRSKFNIALIVLQVLAVLCYLLSFVADFFVVLFLLLESAFLIAWGIKMILSIRKVTQQIEVFERLSTDARAIELNRKRAKQNKRNYIFVGIALIILGCVLLLYLF